MSPNAPLPPSRHHHHHHHQPLRSQFLPTIYHYPTILYMYRTTVVQFHPVTTCKAFRSPSHVSVSVRLYHSSRTRIPHYRINATATVAVTSPRSCVAATPQLPSNYYSCFVFMTTFSFIFILLVRFYPPLRRRHPRFFSVVRLIPPARITRIHCYKTTMYLRPPIMLYSSSEEVRENKEKKTEKIKKLVPCQSKTSVSTNPYGTATAFFDCPDTSCIVIGTFIIISLYKLNTIYYCICLDSEHNKIKYYFI